MERKEGGGGGGEIPHNYPTHTYTGLEAYLFSGNQALEVCYSNGGEQFLTLSQVLQLSLAAQLKILPRQGKHKDDHHMVR